MRRPFRDVTGGEEALSDMIPGMGFMNYILGWVTVPAETFLRRNFGERYYTRSNFFAGLVVLMAFYFSGSLIGLILPTFSLFGRGGSSSSVMGKIIFLYIGLGIFHFLRIWWNDVMGRGVHSFYAGSSWLRPIGKLVMFALNLFLNRMVRAIAKILPGYSDEQVENALPVLRDVNTFTERFVEPLFLLVVGMIASSFGQSTVVFWMLFSIMALRMYTGLRHQSERAYILDIRDQIIESRQLQEAILGQAGEESMRSGQLDRVIEETAKEAEKMPEVMERIKSDNPSLADAVAAFNKRKKKIMENGDGLGGLDLAA